MINPRNILLHTIFCILTLGLYSFYWQWLTARDMAKLGRLQAYANVVGFLQWVPFLSFYADWKWAEGASETLEYRWNFKFLFYLADSIILTFIPLIILQKELNRRAIAGAKS